jgi:molybdopterin converting factor small subunit
MAKIIGKGPLRSFSQEIVLATSIRVQDLPGLLSMPEELAEIVLVVRNHQKLDFDELINDDDEVFLFMAVMGG